MLRLFALWLVLASGRMALLNHVLAAPGQGGRWAAHALAACGAAAALLLWALALPVARRLLPGPAAQARLDMDATSAVTVTFVAAGLLVVTLKALTPVADYLALLALMLASGQSQALRSPGLHVPGLTGVFMLVAGLALVVKAHALARRVLPDAARRGTGGRPWPEGGG